MPYVLRGSLGDEYRIDTRASIGRDVSNQIVLPDLLVSRMHAVLVVEQGVLRVFDNGSSNGTRVNGVQVKTETLKPGDIVQLGNTPLTVDYLPDPPAPETAQTVIGAPEPYGAPPPPAYSAAGYSQPSPVDPYPPAAPAYARLARPYPEPPVPGYGAPGAPAPARPRKSALGRILVFGCLLPIFLCALLGVGAYVALRAGIVNLTSLGLGPGDIVVDNRRGEAFRVTLLELAPPSGEAPIRGALLVDGTGPQTYRVSVPGRYQIDFALASTGARLGSCLLNIKSGGRYQFVALADSITIVDLAAPPAAGQNIATSALCR